MLAASFALMITLGLQAPVHWLIVFSVLGRVGLGFAALALLVPLAAAAACPPPGWDRGELDALIDSATRQVLPDDAKPRAVLRIMLAGWLRLDTPPHAVIATGLELLSGGPRRLAHGVFSTLVKRGVTLPAAPTLPPPVVERWGERSAEIAAALAEPPPLDLTLRDPAETAQWVERLGGQSLAPGHVRIARAGSVEALPGFAEGAWWVQDLAASAHGPGVHGHPQRKPAPLRPACLIWPRHKYLAVAKLAFCPLKRVLSAPET